MYRLSGLSLLRHLNVSQSPSNLAARDADLALATLWDLVRNDNVILGHL